MNAILRYLPGSQADTPLSLFSDARVDDVTVQSAEISPATTGGRLDWAELVAQRVVQLAKLRPNWDGRNSASISPETLAFVLTLLAQTMPPIARAPGMIPLGDGDVQLVWQSDNAELEVEVARPNDVHVYFLDRASGTEREFHVSVQLKELSELLWNMFPA